MFRVICRLLVQQFQQFGAQHDETSRLTPGEEVPTNDSAIHAFVSILPKPKPE